MTKLESRPLPPELVSLVHHIQLHDASWWKQALDRLIIAAIWLAEEQLLSVQLADEIERQFKVIVDRKNVIEQAEALLADGVLVHVSGGYLKIAEEEKKKLEQQAEESVSTEDAAKKSFAALIAPCPELDADATWDKMNRDLLLPMICALGARTYELMSGSSVDIENVKTMHSFLAPYPDKQRTCLRTAIGEFLASSDTAVREYVLGHLNAYFVVEASQLREDNIRAISEALGGKPSFTAFADTNFVFSLLGLHDDEVNEAAHSLLELAHRLVEYVKVSFYILPPTVDEVRAALEMEMEALSSLRLTPNLAAVALSASDVTDSTRILAAATVRAGRPLSAKDLFGPFISNTVKLLRDRGVELFNANFLTYETSEAVERDVKRQMAVNEMRKKNGKRAKRTKTEAQVKHDTMLWHFVRDKRPKRIDSPLEAGYWILTEDFRFIGFDTFKGRGVTNYIASCMHPLTFLQMLQFWVPRSRELETALLSNLRLAVRDFDRKAEQVTGRILQSLSQYEDVQLLPSDTIASVLMNQAMRQSMQNRPTVEKDQVLVRDALLEEHNRVAEEHGRALGELEKKESALAENRTIASDLAARLLEAEEGKKKSERAVDVLRSQIEADKADREKNDRDKEEVSRFVRRGLITPFLVLLVLAIPILLSPLPTMRSWEAKTLWILTPLLAWLFLADRAGSRRNSVSKTEWFAEFHRFRSFIFSAVGVIVAGVIVNLISDSVKAQRSAEATPVGAKRSPSIARTQTDSSGSSLDSVGKSTLTKKSDEK